MLTLITGRAAAFVECTPSAVSRPTITASACAHCQSAPDAAAANSTAPDAGRMKVWTASLTESTAGILSASSSIASRTPMMISAGVLPRMS